MPWNRWRSKKRAAAAEAPRWEYNCEHPRRVQRTGVIQVARRSRAHPTIAAAAAAAAAAGGRAEDRYRSYSQREGKHV